MKAPDDIKRFESSDASIGNLFGFVYIHSQYDLKDNDWKDFNVQEWE
jgi:hypothetical protein